MTSVFAFRSLTDASSVTALGYSILFHSILFYSILFYSTLLYSDAFDLASELLGWDVLLCPVPGPTRHGSGVSVSYINPGAVRRSDKTNTNTSSEHHITNKQTNKLQPCQTSAAKTSPATSKKAS